ETVRSGDLGCADSAPTDVAAQPAKVSTEPFSKLLRLTMSTCLRCKSTHEFTGARLGNHDQRTTEDCVIRCLTAIGMNFPDKYSPGWPKAGLCDWARRLLSVFQSQQVPHRKHLRFAPMPRRYEFTCGGSTALLANKEPCPR